MCGVTTPVSEQRHKNMSAIKSKDTSIEVRLRKALWHKGYRYRKNYKGLPGTPDIVLTRYKIAIFCDSEFFHGKDWDELRLRLENGSNSSYWVKKISRNIERDSRNDRSLKAVDWTVLRFWGEDIMKHTDECIRTIEETIFIRTKEEEDLLTDYPDD
jgi:DNA mismatch endonuclease (patch repair protein)